MSSVKIKQEMIAELEASLVRHVRLQERVSRVELSRQLNLAPSTVGLYVDRLIEEGILQEGSKAPRAAGRPPKILKLNPKAGEFIGIDFDARQIAVTSIDFSQHILQQHQQSLRAADGMPQVLEKLEQAICNEAAKARRLLGIGLAVPGTVDSPRGVALHYGHIRGWRDVPLVERLSRRFRVPIYLENNIRAMALAEQWFGAARLTPHFVCLGIRSGIGAGVVIDGRLHRGHDGLAGEIGAWPSSMERTSSIETGEGKLGPSSDSDATLEQVASVRSILERLGREVRGGAPTRLVLKRHQVTLEEMLRAARDADPLVLRVLGYAAEAIARVLGPLSLLLNPQKVIIAGPLAELSDAFVEPLAKRVQELATPLQAKPPEIVASAFGEFGGALGAAALAVHHWKPERA